LRSVTAPLLGGTRQGLRPMTDKATLEAVRFAVGGITAGPEDDWCDNLTVALCTYFESHPGKPDTDEETEHGWHPWAEEQADSLIEAIAQAAIDAMPGWDWACDSMADAFLYKPGKRPDHDHMDVMGCAKNSPATAFAIAMLRAVGEKE